MWWYTSQLTCTDFAAGRGKGIPSLECNRAFDAHPPGRVQDKKRKHKANAVVRSGVAYFLFPSLTLQKKKNIEKKKKKEEKKNND